MGTLQKVLAVNRFFLTPLISSGRFITSNIQRFFTQMATNNSSVAVLTNRLNDAERNIRLLTVEVKKIRMELNRLASQSASDAIDSISDSTSSVGKLKRTYTEKLEGSKKCKMDFTYEGDCVVVYTDGACSSNGRKGAKAGIGVWWGDNHPLNVSKPTSNRNTNNTAEIEACAEACRVAADNGVTKLLIKTDSNFTINCMKQWIHKWKKNNWKKADGKDVINKDDLVELERQSKRLEAVEYEHVNGHSGIRGNEEADKLAVRGAEMS